MERWSYKEMRRNSGTTSPEECATREPKDSEELYWLFAIPLNINWILVEEHHEQHIGIASMHQSCIPTF